MKYIILSLCLSMMDHLAVGQTTGDYKSHQSGIWNVNTTWDQWDGSAWIHPAISPPNETSGVIAIESGHIIAIAVSITVDQVIVRQGGELLINPGRTLTIIDDGTPAIDLLVAGEVTIEGILATSRGSILSNSGALLATADGSSSSTATNLIIEGDFINDGIIDFEAGTVVFTGDSTTLSGTPSSTSFFSMRIDSGSIVTSVIPLKLRNNLTVSESATFLAGPGADATLFGNLSVTGTFVSHAMVVFPDTTTITGVGSKSFKDVLITGVLTPNAAYTITGNLSLSGSGTLLAGNSTTSFSGNTVFSNSGTGPASFYNITIPASAAPFSLTVNADLTILGGTLRWNNGSFYSNSETTFGRAGTTRLTGTGSIHFNLMTVNAGTTFRPNIPCTVTGNVVVNGTLIASNTVTFGGSTAFTTSGTPTISFTHLIIGSGSSLTVPTGTVTINGNFTNNGSFDSNGGTIAFAGSTAKKISGTSTSRFHHISVINGSAGTDVSVEGNSTLSGTLSLATNAHFDADGSAGTGTFTLLSSADNPTMDASIAVLPTGAIVQGNVTVQRYVSTEGPNNHRIYRYISSPVSNATVADLQNEIPVTGMFTGRSTCDGCGSQPSMFWYDEGADSGGGNGYTPFPTMSNTEVLLPGRGYAVFVRGNVDPVMGKGSSKYDLRGPVNSGTLDYHVTFTLSGTPAGDGWNLVGNPYPSTIHWNAPTGWIKTNLGGSIYRLDNGENPSRYAAWNGTVGTNGGSPLIAPGQGFFVQAIGPSPSLISDENVKMPGATTTYFRLAGPTYLLRISLSTGLWRDESVLHFRDSASGEFDFKYDAIKLKNLLNGNSSTPFLNLSTLSSPDDQKLAINSLPPLAVSFGPGAQAGPFRRACSASVRLDVSDVPAGDYSLDFSNLESFPTATVIVLTDNFTSPKTEVDLRRQAVYSFQVTNDSLSFGATRFQLAFYEQPIPNLDTRIADVCRGADAVVLVRNSLAGINYFVERNGAALGPATSGNGSSISLLIDKDSVIVGFNKLNIVAQSSSCSALTVRRQDSVRVLDVHPVNQVSSTPACQSGAITMTAGGAPVDGYYRWYEHQGDLWPMADQSSSVFITPVLTRSKTFYVAAVNALDCEGERTSVTASIVNYDTAEITQIDPNTLKSNYETGNHWYRDGQLLDDTTALLRIESPGLYTLNVEVKGCLTSDERIFAISGLAGNIVEGRFYPNPVTGILSVEIDDVKDHLTELAIFNARGEELGRLALTAHGGGRRGEFDFNSYPAGLYFIRIPSGKNGSLVKIIKK